MPVQQYVHRATYTAPHLFLVAALDFRFDGCCVFFLLTEYVLETSKDSKKGDRACVQASRTNPFETRKSAVPATSCSTLAYET